MDVAAQLREARFRTGLSQRAFAAEAGVSRRVVEEAEAGRRAPALDALDRLLALAGLELAVRPRVAASPAVDEAALRAHLRLPLTVRVARAAGSTLGMPQCNRGGPLWQELCRLAGLGEGVATAGGPLALSAWLPGMVVPIGQPLHLLEVHLSGLRPPCRGGSGFDLDLGSGPPGSPHGQVRVLLPSKGCRRAGRLFLPPPAELAQRTDDPAVERALQRVGRLLHEESPRDAAGRRPPAHVAADGEAEAARARREFVEGPGGARLPHPLTGRGWRLGVQGSYAAEAAARGLQPAPVKPGWSRWGWG